MARGKRKKEKYIAYDYEAAYTAQFEKINEIFAETILANRRKMVYALKEIKAGNQLEIEIYPQFTRVTDLPMGMMPKPKNKKAQRNLNDKNARKYVERLINENFNENDIWATFTYDNEHLPPDGDIDRAMVNMQNWIKKVNRKRKKKGLKNARYIYVTEYSPYDEIRWHHHIIIDGDLPMDELEAMWTHGRRNQVRRLSKDENGLSGMANYIVKEKDRLKHEKRWNSSKGLKKPKEKTVHSKKDKGGKYKRIEYYAGKMVADWESVREYMEMWYPQYTFTRSEIRYNEFNCQFYIATRMRKLE